VPSAGDTRFVVLTRGSLHLVAISRMMESDNQLRLQLDERRVSEPCNGRDRSVEGRTEKRWVKEGSVSVDMTICEASPLVTLGLLY
jgi:hypothetical protein